jgi:hypothetical protein
VKDLFLCEQFILCCSKDLGLFLKERIPKTIQEMARFADQFAEARTTTTSSLAQKPAIDKKPASDKQTQPNQAGSGIKCFTYRKYGHKSFNCKTSGGTYKQETQRSSNNSRSSNSQNHGHGKGGQASACLEEQSDLPCVGGSSVPSEINMPVVKGSVRDKLVTVLRDTGCSGAVIRKDLVREDQLTGTTQRCKLADGQII